MKKILILVLALVLLGAAGFLVKENLPMKRHARHLIKARLLASEGNLAAALKEFEKAYDIMDGYTPWVDIEVLRIVNRMHLQEKDLAAALADTRKFTQTHPDNAEGRVMLAELALQAGETAEAFAAIEAVLARDPGDFAARLFLARVRTRQGRLDLAEEQLRALHAAAPDSLDALIPLAENMLRQGHFTESREFLRKAVAAKPANGMVRLLLVDGYILERKPDSARLILDEWMDADPALAVPIAIRKSNLLALEDSFPEALAALKPHLEKKEEKYAAWSAAAVLHARQGRFDSAVATYGVMEEFKPSAAGELMVMKAYLNLKTRNPARALEALKKVSTGDRTGTLIPALAVTYLALGQEHKLADLVRGQPDTVAAGLQNFAAQFPKDPAFIGQWALVSYYQLNRQPYPAYLAVQELHAGWPKAPLAITLWSSQLASVRNYARAAEVLETLPAPNLAQRTALLGLLLGAGKADKARALAERILAENPGRPGINLFLADWHFARGSKDAAVVHYERELALDTANLVALNNLAWEHGVVRKDLAKARPYLERLRRYRAQDPRILDTIGWILATNGDPEARGYLETAVLLVPDQPAFNYHLAWVLERAGDKERARKHLRAALSSGRPFEDKADAEKLLAGL